MEFWKRITEDQVDIDFDFNLRTRDRKVVLTARVSHELDLRVLFPIVSELKERELLLGQDIEKFQEFYINGFKMKNKLSEQIITLYCQIESVTIYASMEESEGEDHWILMYEDEYEEVVKWNISA
ncbi:MAG: hypothetical protein ACRCU6_05670 [Fusobacteriaceae bacterium]